MAKQKLCDGCRALCCGYFALPIETPKTRQDFDNIRWYLCHQHVSIFVEKNDWYLGINNKCRHTSKKDHRCSIYDNRPKICRSYSTADCDRIEGDYEYRLHFKNDRQMEEYIKIKFDNNKKKKFKKTRTKK